MRVSVIGQEDLDQGPRPGLGVSVQDRHAHEERHDAEEIRESYLSMMYCNGNANATAQSRVVKATCR
jgi:hypothetical protein